MLTLNFAGKADAVALEAPSSHARAPIMAPPRMARV